MKSMNLKMAAAFVLALISLFVILISNRNNFASGKTLSIIFVAFVVYLVFFAALTLFSRSLNKSWQFLDAAMWAATLVTWVALLLSDLMDLRWGLPPVVRNTTVYESVMTGVLFSILGTMMMTLFAGVRLTYRLRGMIGLGLVFGFWLYLSEFSASAPEYSLTIPVSPESSWESPQILNQDTAMKELNAFLTGQ